MINHLYRIDKKHSNCFAIFPLFRFFMIHFTDEWIEFQSCEQKGAAPHRREQKTEVLLYMRVCDQILITVFKN